MKKQPRIRPLKENMAKLHRQFAEEICRYDSPYLKELRDSALSTFMEKGFPSHELEAWRNTSLDEALEREYLFDFDVQQEKADINRIFRCEIHNFETFLFTQLNGWYIYENAPLTELPNGVIAGSLREAMKRHPQLFAEHYGRYADTGKNGLVALNTAFAMDGIFIMVPDNTELEKPIQWVNIVNAGEPMFLQPRHLVILGKNSKLTLVHCDDSIQKENTFINAVTEVFTGEGSTLDFYKLQNKDAGSNLVNSLFIHQEGGSRVQTNTITLNGGLIRNDVHSTIGGSQCETLLNGLYLVDRKQHVDNQVFVDHLKPENTSSQLYKGIVDDEADAVFNGHIHVAKDAQKTEAYQTNRNILLSENARVTTKPFLEIYADDVKCSHGATVGQLDPEALFYLRSRGICERNARMLLMYAFAAEVVGKINIDILRDRIDQMVQKRLKGELSICDQCVLHCKDERDIVFEIDMSKIPS